MADTSDEKDLQLPQYNQPELICLDFINKCVRVMLVEMRNYPDPTKIHKTQVSTLSFFAQKL